MGTTLLNNVYPMGMVFDIETIPGAAVMTMAPPEEFLLKGSRSNFKPETLEAHKQTQAQLWPEEQAQIGSLDWRYGEIFSYGVGWWERDMEGVRQVVRIGFTCDSPIALPDSVLTLTNQGIHVSVLQFDNESSMLREFWRHVHNESNRHQVGFYCRDFDCPWVLFRSAVNGVTPTRIWNTGRYTITGERVDLIDLADILSWQGKFTTSGWSLDTYCDWFDLEWKPRGKGCDVYEQYKNGEYGKIVEHQVFDILATMSLYLRMSPVIL